MGGEGKGEGDRGEARVIMGLVSKVRVDKKAYLEVVQR